MLLLAIWGPLFYYSTSDVLGQTKPARVEGVHVQLDVRALAGVCDRPDLDPDGCTVDTYTLWSSSSAKFSPVVDKDDMYGRFQTEDEIRQRKNIQGRLEENYK